jgi:hypothetical protein
MVLVAFAETKATRASARGKEKYLSLTGAKKLLQFEFGIKE